MSQFIEGPRKTFTAGESGGANLRWYISDGSTSPPTVSIAGAANPGIGVNEDAVLASGDLVSLRLTNSQGTVKMVAAGAITAGNKVYAAADGEVTSSGTLTEGIACEAATTDQDIIEVMNLMASAAAEYDDDELLAVGSGADALLMWSTGDADNHSLVVGLGDSNQALHVTDKAARATDWAVAADTHPTIYVHSNTTPATDYVKIGAHDGSACWLGDVVGGGTAYIGFDGLEVLEFTETASAVNHIGIVNAATGNNPIIRAEGEADTGITFDNSEGEEILILDAVATAVNELTISNAATGNDPSIAATGETNVGIDITPKGTGTVNLTQAKVNFAVAAVAATGSNQGDAAALTAGAMNVVSAGDDTKGVVLPTAATTEAMILVLNSGSAGLKIYPASSDKINNGSADASVAILEDTLALLVPTAADNWAMIYTANS